MFKNTVGKNDLVCGVRVCVSLAGIGVARVEVWDEVRVEVRVEGEGIGWRVWVWVWVRVGLGADGGCIATKLIYRGTQMVVVRRCACGGTSPPRWADVCWGRRGCETEGWRGACIATKL